MPLVLPPIPTALGVLDRRPRDQGDAGTLLALFASARRAELDLTGWDDEQRRSFLELQLRARTRHQGAVHPEADLSMVTLDGTTIGQLDLARGSDGGIEVLEVGLLPGLRGHGLGTALLAAVVAAADAEDVAVHLHVEPSNPARRLYQRLGFVPTGETPTHVALARPPGGPGRAGGHEVSWPRPEGGTPRAGPDAGPPDGTGMALAPVASALEPVGAIPLFDDLVGLAGARVECLPDGPTLAIAAVDPTRAVGPGQRQPYSLLLHGPRDRPLDQGLHRLRIAGGDPLDLFLVPLQPTTERAFYEIIIT